MVRAAWLLVFALVLAAVAPAKAQDRAWLDDVADDVRDLALQTSCFGGQPPRTLYVLGVAGSDDLVDRADQTDILGRLTARLGDATRMQITKADTFQIIAGATTAGADRGAEQIRRLLDDAERADITLTLRPFRRASDTLSAEVVLWARNASNQYAITCTPSFIVSIPVGDPQCQSAFETVRRDGASRFMEPAREIL